MITHNPNTGFPYLRRQDKDASPPVTLEQVYMANQKQSEGEVKRARKLVRAVGCGLWSTGTLVVVIGMIYLALVSLRIYKNMSAEYVAAEYAVLKGDCRDTHDNEAPQEMRDSEACLNHHRVYHQDRLGAFGEKLLAWHTGPIQTVFSWPWVQWVCFWFFSQPAQATAALLTMTGAVYQVWKYAIRPCVQDVKEEMKPTFTGLPT